jgi:L-cystine uptake protein TcyP (sodium:dicarboxylate symporter family)
VTNQTPQPVSRLERVLAYMVASVVGISILAFVAMIIATSMGVGANGGLGRGIWPYVITLPAVGLPVGFVLIIALMVSVGVRRSREARRDRE